MTIAVAAALWVAASGLVLVRTASAMIGMVAVVALGYAGFLLSIPFVSIDVTLWDAFLGCVNLLPLGLFFYALSLWLGAVMLASMLGVRKVIRRRK